MTNISHQKISVRRIIKMLIISVLASFILILLLFLDGACKTYTSGKIVSTAQYVAYSSVMNCGATEAYSNNIHISKPILGFSIPRINDRSVFSSTGSLDSVEVEWIDDRTLKIILKECGEIYRKDTSWQNITIVYDNQCTN